MEFISFFDVILEVVQLIGLSLSACIHDILLGKVAVEQVDKLLRG